MKQLKRPVLVLVVLLCLSAVMHPAVAQAAPAPKSEILVNGTPLDQATPQGVSYNEGTGTLTLNNFKGQSIVVGASLMSPFDLVIDLKGRNPLSTTGCLANTVNTDVALAGFYSGADGGTSITITSASQGSLTINRTYADNDSVGNRLLVGVWAGGDINLQGSAQLTVNLWNHLYQPAKMECIRSTSGSLTVGDRAQLRTFASAPTATRARGICLGAGEQLVMASMKPQVIDLSGVICSDTAGLEIQNTPESDAIHLNVMPELTIRAAGVLSRGSGTPKTPSVSGYAMAAWTGETHYINNTRGYGGGAWTRLWGNNALDTMAKIVGSGDGNTYGDAFDQVGGTVVIATDGGYKDALAATALAGIDGGPVLLTNKTKLSDQTKKELKRLRPARIYIAGGTSVVSTAVENEIKSVTGVIPVRAAGQNAVLTAVDIYDKAKGRWGRDCIVATTASYKDALSIAPYAYAKHAPIFLTNPKSIDQKVVDRIASGGFSRVIIVGGPNAVSGGIQTKLAAKALTVRYGGANALDTSGIIACMCLEEGMGIEYLGIATAGGFKDALTGAALCGRNNAPITLVGTGTKNLAQQCTAIDQVVSASDKTWIDHAYVFGGPAAVSAQTFSYILGAYSMGVG